MSGIGLATWVSALAAAGGFAAAAFQLWGLRMDAVATRAREMEGVSLETDVRARPITADAGAGRSRWVYLFSIQNPGRLPITEVEAVVTFTMPVTREHFDG